MYDEYRCRNCRKIILNNYQILTKNILIYTRTCDWTWSQTTLEHLMNSMGVLKQTTVNCKNVLDSGGSRLIWNRSPLSHVSQVFQKYQISQV